MVTKKKIYIKEVLRKNKKPKARALGSFSSGREKVIFAVGNGENAQKKQIRVNPYLLFLWKKQEKEMLEKSNFPIDNYTLKGKKSL